MIVECIPNFSEGRRQEVIDRIGEGFKSVKGCVLLDVKPDKDHNRTVYTVTGEPEAVLEGVIRAVGTACELIDMNEHRGEHPRIGACDVIPFVPISGMTMEDCVALSRRCAEAVWEKYRIPSYYYEESALRPSRRNLADIRKGEYEVLKEEASLPERTPDVGEPALHPTAGAVVIGAREPLIAYNVNLSTSDISIAKAIAKRMRAKTGGLAYVKALGVMLSERNIAQVSMNLTNFNKTAVYTVFEMVKIEAARYGVTATGSEVIGMIPLEALAECARYYLRLENFETSQILETHLMQAE
ncbi:MAG: glutamate formimidoyltransferase [bacterium]|nr:glutamate formimidoyltransferase [bacterium]